MPSRLRQDIQWLLELSTLEDYRLHRVVMVDDSLTVKQPTTVLVFDRTPLSSLELRHDFQQLCYWPLSLHSDRLGKQWHWWVRFYPVLWYCEYWILWLCVLKELFYVTLVLLHLSQIFSLILVRERQRRHMIKEPVVQLHWYSTYCQLQFVQAKFPYKTSSS